MVRTVIYLILFILAIVFLFQNGGQPVTLNFLNWSTPEPIPVGFVFIGALLFGAVVVWLWNLPQIVLLKGRVRSLNKRITRLMEDKKRKENDIESLMKKKEELEKKLKELSDKIKVSSEEKIEEKETKPKEEGGEEDEVKEEKKGGFFGIFKGRKSEGEGD